ncbi:SDR family NAD(P)-dependent oxidoreductase [Hoeflea sp. YIM 152468]|uniref:SDR family NAD(P)-dependent oxidoreductase n=1 Tax=Hoeflea sp. YIM 152468 TaxID=3031759 RepID=UPI0023DC3F8C|nr:SDR family NAD(P)-dependent oxidoreductase [Hoeflea sp. YIM 152468]MDF1609730.1 SDR family NAD(P)-dependent oxidoreductase [Hoeflea sp. YIM 152468]
MPKTILITGSTDGIGLETAKLLVAAGHKMLLHGRNPAKLADVAKRLAALPGAGAIETFVADLSRMAEVETLAREISAAHDHIDVLINNAGILKTDTAITAAGLDVRFAVNTIAPYLLTRQLLPLMRPDGRVVNLSSAAQAPVDLKALEGQRQLSAMEAYAQSKLALTMWSRHMAEDLKDQGPAIIAVNPGSLLASKMVRQGFGVAGSDLAIGATILVRAALEAEFAAASGRYFDNDNGRFAAPHPDGLDDGKCAEVVRVIESLIRA